VPKVWSQLYKKNMASQYTDTFLESDAWGNEILANGIWYC